MPLKNAAVLSIMQSLKYWILVSMATNRKKLDYYILFLKDKRYKLFKSPCPEAAASIWQWYFSINNFVNFINISAVGSEPVVRLWKQRISKPKSQNLLMVKKRVWCVLVCIWVSACDRSVQDIWFPAVSCLNQIFLGSGWHFPFISVYL